MSNKDNGGSAFPVTPTDKSGQISDTELGMSLRDKFAETAMHAIYTRLGGAPTMVGNDLDYMADCAYLAADAMLRSRIK